MAEAKLTIGHVAHAAGVNVETVRYYQRRGLVNLPPKRARGFRYYTPETAGRVRFIKRAQALGMSLKEVQRLFTAISSYTWISDSWHCSDMPDLETMSS